ncbi:MAG: RNA methyltransferase [Rickettsiaceae bacterium]
MINNNIAIILVAPQMGENIGASARAMKNFGLKDLRIVSPRDGWPNTKAESMSVGAIDIINQAKIFSSIEQAISDLSCVYATTGVPRDMNKNYVLSKNLDQDIPNDNSIGIMFGRENCGLNNQEIAYANKILVIDTDKKFTSLNIFHAVSIICYELFKIKNQSRSDLDNSYKLASQAELNYFYEHLFSKLDEKGFFRVAEKKKQMGNKIRNLFSRIDKISQVELQTLRGIVTVLTSEK